jgi:nucleoside-diphosphate-sugar epimerase
MRIFFTGATGVVGREAVPLLVSAGHEVVAVARGPEKASWLEHVGAQPVEVDLFDRGAVSRVIEGSDVVVHFATAIPPMARMAKREAWEGNDRLRSEATANLVDAALENGVGRFVQQSIVFVYADGGEDWLDEQSPVEPVWDALDSALTAESHVERFSQAGRAGVSLRLGRLYGPGRASAGLVEAVASRKGAPSIGKGDNYVSSLHIEDAARALEAALSLASGVYNVVDDEPVRSKVLIDSLSGALGVKPPRRVPEGLARVVAGPAAHLLTVSHRVSNRSFTGATGWKPEYPTITEGWARMLG